MAVATVTSKGQITVPKEVREELGLTAGSQVVFVRLGEGHYRMLARTESLTDLAGVLHRAEQPVRTIEEMNEAIAAGAASSDEV